MEEAENELRKRKAKRSEKDPMAGGFLPYQEKHQNNSLPNSFGYGIIIAFLFIIFIFHKYENYLPEQIKLKDASLNKGRFIGERAQLQLKRLTNLGTRVVGSYENEVLAVDFLKREISFIQQKAEKIHKIEVDIQRPTGSYYLMFKPHGFRNYYANIQNVVVKLSSGNNTESVLMNCHYDTVPESPVTRPGVAKVPDEKLMIIILANSIIFFYSFPLISASDNGLNCVVMLEILQVLASEKTPLKNNIIFLFNGAEENPLQASHGFLSHKWSKEVKVLINLDSAGAGGREMLFQTSGEAWLAKLYAKVVPRPTAGVQGEEIFQFGIIPSDTDFRVFRDFASYPGFDLAHCTNGYIYHTKFDTMDFIRPGVYQNTGDNLLALVRELANSSELSKTHSKTRLVYFDVFTLFTVVYTEKFAFVVNSVTILLSVAAILKVMRKLPDKNQKISISLLLSTGGQMFGLFLGGTVVYFIAKTLDSYKAVMSWYLRPWLLIPLYAFPIALAMMASLLLVQTYMRTELSGYRTIRFVNGAQLFWTLILLIGTLKGIRSSFMLMFIILFPSIGSLIASHSEKIISVKKYLITYACCMIFPVLYILSQTVRILTVLIPMAARMGPHKNPEEIMGALVFACTTVFLAQIVPYLLMLRKLKRFLISLCFIHLLAVIMVVATQYGFPYDGNVQSPAFQRFYLLHCERTFHDAKGSVRKSDSGIFVQSLDRNNVNYLKSHVPELQDFKPIAEDCDQEIFCGFPVFTSRFISPAPHSYFIPAAAPTIHHPTSMEVINQTQILVNTRRIHILITGPDHITVGMVPRKGIKLVKWSFDDAPPISLATWNDREVFMVYYSHGLMGGTLEFYVDLQTGKDPIEHVLDVAVVGHYMHDKKFRTDEFKKLLSRFPDWAHVTPWTTTYKSWII